MADTTYIYHITPLDNLIKILDCGSLWSYNQMKRTDVLHSDIAHSSIQDRRATTLVPCGRGGTLHDYVPFYFAPRSPMLYTLHRGNVTAYTSGQHAIVYLVSAIDTVQAYNLPFVFSDGHGIMSFTQFYTDLADLKYVDWEIMQAKYWADTFEDGDRTRRRQAEFLIYDQCPWPVIRGIGVMNDEMKIKVEQTLAANEYTTRVAVRADWYY